jgi:tetraacyldisaccharide-1-P 4'-kinase
VDDFKAMIARADHAGARALLTTEKDMINLAVVPPSLPPSFYCRIELEIENETAFLTAIVERLALQPAAQPAR